MTPEEIVQVASLRDQARALGSKVAEIYARMQRRWENAPGRFVTGSSGRRQSGLSKCTEPAQSANTRDTARITRLQLCIAHLENRALAIERREAREAKAALRQEVRKVDRQCERRRRKEMPLDERLFCGVFPAGWSWADLGEEVGGDYQTLACMSFTKLVLEFRPDCPDFWKPIIEAQAQKLQAMRGQKYIVSGCGQYVILGE